MQLTVFGISSFVLLLDIRHSTFVIYLLRSKPRIIAPFPPILLLRRNLESYISRSPSRSGGQTAFCRHWHGVENDPSKGFPHETPHRPRFRFTSGSRHDRLLLHTLLQLTLRFRRRMRIGWLRRSADLNVCSLRLFELRGLLTWPICAP